MAFYSFFIVLLACSYATQGAVIPQPDSYDERENEIFDHENEEIGGLLPPLEGAVDYYNTQQPKEPEFRNSSYVIDMVNNVLRLVNNRNTTEDDSSDENDFMKKVGLEFAQLFAGLGLPEEVKTDKNIKPTLTFGDDGVSFELAGTDSKDGAFNVREEATTEIDFTTTMESEAMTTELPQSDEAQPRADEDPALSFVQAIWDTVRTSIAVAAKWIFGSENADSTTVPPTVAAPSTSSGLVALEEPLSRHRLPSQEFEKGGRDIDSLLYGRGIA